MSGMQPRRWVMATGIGLVLALSVGTTALSAEASTGTVPGSATAAAVQSLLDRVLGPGNAVVIVTDTVTTSSGVSTTQRFGSGVPTGVSAATTVTANGTTRVSVQQNAIGTTSTTIAAPPGSLVSQFVSVVVNRRQLGGRSLASIRSLVAASAGIIASRGDRLSVVATRFAAIAAPSTPATPAVLTALMGWVPMLLWLLGGIAALAVLTAAVRGTRRA